MQLLTSIITKIVEDLFANLLYEQLGIVLSPGQKTILFVILALFVFKPLLAKFYERLLWSLEGIVSAIRGGFKYLYAFFIRDVDNLPQKDQDHFQFKREMYLNMLNSTLPISGFAIGLLLCKDYYPWSEGWLSLLAWLSAVYPAVASYLGLNWDAFEKLRFRLKIKDLFDRYGRVEEKWLKEVLPKDKSRIRKNMEIYVEETFYEAIRLDKDTQPDNWAILKGGYGLQKNYHKPSVVKIVG